MTPTSSALVEGRAFLRKKKEEESTKIAILGGGRLGTALAIVLSRSRKPHEISLWVAQRRTRRSGSAATAKIERIFPARNC